MTKYMFLFLLGMGLAACATTDSNWKTTGGNREEGRIRLSYEQKKTEVVEIDDYEGFSKAREKCSSWGYGNVERAGEQTRNCVESAPDGCRTWLISREYRCFNMESR